MVLAGAPTGAALQPCGAIHRQHLVARILHDQSLGRRVHALVGIRRRMARGVRADEHAQVIARGILERALPHVAQKRMQQLVARIDIGISRVHRAAHLAKLRQVIRIELAAVQPRQHAVRGRPAVQNLSLIHICSNRTAGAAS